MIKGKVRDFFKARFESVDGLQVKLDNVPFNSIFVADKEMLVGNFSKEEVKEAVWDCESSKSPGLDGFNFGLIKFCWEFIREDNMLAVNDFARVEK